MDDRRLEAYLDRYQPGREGVPAEGWWPRREEMRERLLALVAAYEEMGMAAEEALGAALARLEAEAAPARRRDAFPTFRAAARRAAAFGRRARPVLGGALALLLCVYVGANIATGRALERELAAIRDRGEPLTLSEVAPPPVPDGENAALVYQLAFERLPRLQTIAPLGEAPDLRTDREDERVIARFVSSDARERRGVTLARVRQALAGTEESAALARRAAAMPGCRFPVRWEDGFGALFPHYRGLRALSRVLAARAVVEAIDGRPYVALADIRAIAGIAQHVAAEPTLIGRVVQYQCLATACDALRRVLEVATPGEAESRRLAQAFAEADLERSFARSMEAERCLGLWAYDFARRHPDHLAELTGSGVHPLLRLSAALRPLGDPLTKADEIFYLRIMGEHVARAQQASLPAADPVADEPRVPAYAPMSALLLPSVGSVRRKRDEAAAALALARTALALHAYRRETGHYPAALAEARRALGEALSPDPFSGRDFAYGRDGRGYRLYSVGRNGRDDGGRGRPRGTAAAPPAADAPDDVLWDVGG